MRDNFSWIAALVIVATALVVFLALRADDSDSGAPARRALETQGFTEPIITERSVWGELHGCGRNELSYVATATNPAGRRVEVIACCGVWMKACTIRSR